MSGYTDRGPDGTYLREESFPDDRSVFVQFDCGHQNHVGRDEYGNGSAWCNACGSFQVYERCLTCHSLDCQAKAGPTLPRAWGHGGVTDVHDRTQAFHRAVEASRCPDCRQVRGPKHSETCPGPLQRVADPVVVRDDCGCKPGYLHEPDCHFVTGEDA